MNEHLNANTNSIEKSYILYISTSDATFDQFTQEANASYVWSLEESGTQIACGSDALGVPRRGRHTDLLVGSAANAIEKAADNSAIYVVSDVKFFTDLLTSGTALRIGNNYIRKDRKPLAYGDDWRRLDGFVLAKTISLSGGKPRNATEVDLFEQSKAAAATNAKNIGKSPSDWGVY